MRAQGYTLVEALVTMAILAILAAAARPLVAPVSETKLDAAAREVAHALRFARGEALRTGRYHGVDFSVDAGTGRRRLRVFRTDTATPPNPVYDVYHPLDKKPYDIQLATGTGTQGATIAEAEFRYSTLLLIVITRDWVAFDASGMPEYYPDAAGYELVEGLLGPAQLTVSLGGKTRNVSVHTKTGRVTVQ